MNKYFMGENLIFAWWSIKQEIKSYIVTLSGTYAKYGSYWERGLVDNVSNNMSPIYNIDKT